MPQTETRLFSVHPTQGGPGQVVEGLSFEDAAVSFVEAWHPPADAEGDVSVIVRDHASGHEHCFLVDVFTGEAGPCD